MVSDERGDGLDKCQNPQALAGAAAALDRAEKETRPTNCASGGRRGPRRAGWLGMAWRSRRIDVDAATTAALPTVQLLRRRCNCYALRRQIDKIASTSMQLMRVDASATPYQARAGRGTGGTRFPGGGSRGAAQSAQGTQRGMGVTDGRIGCRRLMLSSGNPVAYQSCIEMGKALDRGNLSQQLLNRAFCVGWMGGWMDGWING
jgi:hypothetical protein